MQIMHNIIDPLLKYYGLNSHKHLKSLEMVPCKNQSNNLVNIHKESSKIRILRQFLANDTK